MGSDESHFNVSVGSDGQSHKTVSTNHNLFEEKGEPKWYWTKILLLTSLTARPNWLRVLAKWPKLFKYYCRNMGWNECWSKSQHRKLALEIKFSSHSCQEWNPWPFHCESGILLLIYPIVCYTCKREGRFLIIRCISDEYNCRKEGTLLIIMSTSDYFKCRKKGMLLISVCTSDNYMWIEKKE